MNDNLFIANDEQIRSIVVSFAIFLIKEMYQENMLNSNSDKLTMAKYLDDKIDIYINEKKYRKERL